MIRFEELVVGHRYTEGKLLAKFSSMAVFTYGWMVRDEDVRTERVGGGAPFTKGALAHHDGEIFSVCGPARLGRSQYWRSTISLPRGTPLDYHYADQVGDIVGDRWSVIGRPGQLPLRFIVMEQAEGISLLRQIGSGQYRTKIGAQGPKIWEPREKILV